MLGQNYISYSFRGYHTGQEVSFEMGGKGCGKRNKFSGVGQEPKGSWQVHSKFKLLLATEATSQYTSQLKCGSKMRKRPLRALY